MTTRSIIRQGDVLVVPIEKLPTTIVPVEAETGRLILARGEATGHHHSIAFADRVALFAEDGSGRGLFLSVTGAEPVALEHQEHTALKIAPGDYEVRIQRTMRSGLVQRVSD